MIQQKRNPITNTLKNSVTINVVTLGCSKNLVDSEQLLKQLENNGFIIKHDSPIPGDLVIINTCGFIADAKQESIDTISEYIVAKRAGQIKKLYVMGCLSQRYKKELSKNFPEIDGVFGVDCIPEIIKSLSGKYKVTHERILTTLPHFAYLKIAEGCNRTCAFCAIPGIRGKYKSIPINVLVEEAELLAKKGVKELIIIAQDISYYGIDIAQRQLLPELLIQLSNIKGIKWIRLHYAYPKQFPLEVLTIMRETPTICNYLDIPLQHISDNMLKRMRRGHTRSQAEKLIEKIRKEVPGISIRTSLLVGHPGETEQDFKELISWVKKVKLDRVGVFKYSHEEDTYSYKNYKDDIPENIKQKRYNTLMSVQQKIAIQKNHNLIGKTLNVLIDYEEAGYYIGRTESDSPEVDNEVLISKNKAQLKPGDFVPVLITDATEYSISGTINN